MASDPRKLKPSELCRLLNSTPLGEVISERQLYRHRQRAGARIAELIAPTPDDFAAANARRKKIAAASAAIE